MSVFTDFMEDVKKDFKKQKKQITLSDDLKREPIPTGSVVIDETFGGGLFYKGLLGEINSYESGAKTTLALHSCAQALKKYPDLGIIFLDFEFSFDPIYAKSLGVDTSDDRVIVVQPQCIEDADKFLIKAFGKNGKLKGKISTIVIDSVAAARPMGSLEEEMGGSSQKSQHASAWSQWIPKIAKIAHENQIATILLNQFRAKPMMGQMAQYSLSNTGIGQGYSNMDTSISTCVTYDTKIKIRIDGVEKEVTMEELKELMSKEDIVQVKQS